MMVSLQLPQLPHSEERRAFTRMLLRLPSLPAVEREKSHREVAVPAAVTAAVEREKSRREDAVTAAVAPKSQRTVVTMMSLRLSSRSSQKSRHDCHGYRRAAVREEPSR